MIRLSREQAAFLLHVLVLDERLRGLLTPGPDGFMVLDDAQADELRDLCGDRLQTHGFDADYAPTEEGKRLEGLIDLLFVG